MKYLCVDPGETVGWSFWENTEMLDAGQTPLWEFIYNLSDSVMCIGGEYAHNDGPWVGIEAVVMEDWAIYPPGVGPGPPPSWDKCLTARGIGAIQFICRQAAVECVLQPASIKPQAVLGGAEDLFLTPQHENRHANDSIMHAVYYQVVGKGGEF